MYYLSFTLIHNLQIYYSLSPAMHVPSRKIPFSQKTNSSLRWYLWEAQFCTTNIHSAFLYHHPLLCSLLLAYPISIIRQHITLHHHLPPPISTCSPHVWHYSLCWRVMVLSSPIYVCYSLAGYTSAILPLQLTGSGERRMLLHLLAYPLFAYVEAIICVTFYFTLSA